MRACSCTIVDLYAALLGPVESAIARKPKLLMVPTSALTSLPFHFLVARKPGTAVAPDDRYRLAAWLLLNDRAITVLPSVASLRAPRVFAKTSHATKPSDSATPCCGVPAAKYDKASAIAHFAAEHNLTLKEAAPQLGHVDEATFDRVVDPAQMVKP
jgi:hypothetical protein